MYINKTIIKNLIDIWGFFLIKFKIRLIINLILMVISSLLEIVSIGAIIPFLTSISNPEEVFKVEIFKFIFDKLQITTNHELLLFSIVLFISISVFSLFFKLFFLWFNANTIARLSVELKTKIFENVINMTYLKHTKSNSSEILSMLTEKVNHSILASINHVFFILTSIVLSTFIITTLFFINIFVTIIISMILTISFVLIAFIVKKRIKSNGEFITSTQPYAVKNIQESIGGIRDIIIDNNQELFIKSYSKIITPIQNAMSQNAVLNVVPKPIIETIGMIIIIIVAYYYESNNMNALAIVGVFALAAQKLLPSFQQLFYSWSVLTASKKLLSETNYYLHMHNNISETIDDKNISFNENILLKDISFSYERNKLVNLDQINLQINKGDKIGIIGSTGSGKSTLVDLVMGFLTPENGNFYIDNIKLNSSNVNSWRKILSHVPQNIFLTDASIIENVALGENLSEIDKKKVKDILSLVYLDEYIETLPDDYMTRVGERGIQLSGGQRQRIGIARALYKNPEILILDEATSALDNNTEFKIMQNIYNISKNITIIMIAHRITTLSGCNKIIELDKGKIINHLNYIDLSDNTKYRDLFNEK